MFCVPKKDGSYNDRHSHPREWADFRLYGAQDVSAMRAVWRNIPKWNATPRMWSKNNLKVAGGKLNA